MLKCLVKLREGSCQIWVYLLWSVLKWGSPKNFLKLLKIKVNEREKVEKSECLKELFVECDVTILQADGEDQLKKMQLMELSIINGTYRHNNKVMTMQQQMEQFAAAAAAGGGRKSKHFFGALKGCQIPSLC